MPARETLPEWKLTQIYSDETHVEKDLHEVQQHAKKFQRFRKPLETKPTRELVGEAMQELEMISKKGHRVGGYAHLRFAQNTRDEKAKALESKISQRLTQIGNETLFFGIWWKNLDEKTAHQLLPHNKEYAYALTEMRKFKPHMLGEKEEQILNLKDTTGSEAMVKLYEILTEEHRYAWKKGSKTIHIQEEELRKYTHHKDPKLRTRAYALLWDKYKEANPKLGEIYRNIVLDTWNENVLLRKYKSPISAWNLGNELSDETVDTFLSVCEKNAPLFADYLEWKSDALGNPHAREHIYAPFPQPSKKWTFNDAYSKVIQTYGSFSTRMKNEAERVLNEKRMDIPIRSGKQGGAFCSDIGPSETCFLHLNWTHEFRDVTVLAHELGHAIHHHMSGHHSLFTHNAPLPIAETASTFGEMLLTEKMLEENTNPNFQRYLLGYQLDDNYATIMRQAFFCLFEKEAFEMIREGKSIPEVNAAYMRNLRTQFGKKMRIPGNAQYEWSMIGHLFNYPFYVYSYAFGQLLVLAFFERYQKEGKSFVPAYEKFLSYGGSKNPEKMLLEMGFDPTKKQSWQKGFDLLEKKFHQLKKV